MKGSKSNKESLRKGVRCGVGGWGKGGEKDTKGAENGSKIYINKQYQNWRGGPNIVMDGMPNETKTSARRYQYRVTDKSP